MKTTRLTVFSLAIASCVGVVLTSCGDDDNGFTGLPPIGGYNSSDEVGSADLVAYWPLNGNGTESKSNTNPSESVGQTWETAVKGQGLKLTNGYLNYPSIPALSTTMENMSISVWARIYNNGPGGVPTMLLSLARENEWAGNVNFFAETGGRAASNDTLMMKALVVIKNGDASANFQDVINSPNPSAEDLANGHTGNPNKNGGKWAHYVMVWDAPTGSFKIYANGQKISNAKYEPRNSGAALPLNFFTPTHPILGTFQTVLNGTAESWQTAANVEMDEIRVWKKALSAADINSLYELEKQGR